jgi:hypothetical protein
MQNVDFTKTKWHWARLPAPRTSSGFQPQPETTGFQAMQATAKRGGAARLTAGQVIHQAPIQMIGLILDTNVLVSANPNGHRLKTATIAAISGFKYYHP